METTIREKLFAGVFPLVLFGSTYLFLWLPVLLGVVSLILCKRFSRGYGTAMAMKSLDLTFSFFVYPSLTSFLVVAVGIATEDLELALFYLSDGGLFNILSLLFTALFLIAFVAQSIGGFMGRNPVIPFALKPFSYFYGRSSEQTVVR